ncbi:MAG: ABC transporter, substrate-binding protein (cluster 1, maltose/g3p/polyamine/iron) [uncultured Thermomicrobiales bacterium]|uniref:ABC transporter, substrate-binding protein (Cluster 1, maltose/g3p/polyamine/iron) n=1 Tax=uncultured Thermomicrobiales bacterium TaxID=1645740 RepID=A0A6J4V2E0_9BACT|nr:MAG: ABC transporter, substrate-binding protein (cluster 1, maltose/g3p/polyamine/iron) [uncultured Thermomicrobiales bacterium]
MAKQQQAPIIGDPRLAGWRRHPLDRRAFIRTLTFAAGAVYAGSRQAQGTVAQGTTTLTQWYHQYGEAGTEDAVRRYAQEYTEANPNVEVEVNWTVGDYPTILNTALVGGQAPDLFESSPNLDWVRNGLIAPLDDLIPEDIRADFNPRELATNTIEGQLYGVKIVVDTGGIYYRPSYLEQAGLQPPTNVDELIAAATALTDGPVKGLFLGNDGGISSMQQIMPWAAGSDFITADNQVVFDNPATILAYEKLRELNQTDALLVGAPTDWFQPDSLIQGLVAMQWGGLWAMPQVTEELEDDFGFIAFPPLAGASGGPAQPTPATFLGGWSQLVNAKSPNLDAAKAYAKYLWVDNTEAQRDFNLSYGFHVPPRISVAQAAEPLQSGPPAEAVNILNQYGRSLSPLWTGAMGAALGDAVTRIVREGADATAEVTAAAETTRQELQRLLG